MLKQGGPTRRPNFGPPSLKVRGPLVKKRAHDERPQGVMLLEAAAVAVLHLPYYRVAHDLQVEGPCANAL